VRDQGLTVPDPTTPLRRPPLAGRLHYLIGGTLPTEYRLWVERDLTGPRWRHRQASRLVLQTLPIALVFLLLPGRLEVRIGIPIFLLLVSVAMGYGTAGNFRNRRLVQHGLPVPVKPEEDEDL
jgi:hypothetical protein